MDVSQLGGGVFFLPLEGGEGGEIEHEYLRWPPFLLAEKRHV